MQSTTQNLPKLVRQMVRQGRLEDRSEYGVEDLARMYGLSMQDAETLRVLVQRAMSGE